MLALTLLVNLFGTRGAEARTTSCKTDPIVTLSDGTQIQVTATIATSASNVSTVTYTIHGPVGTTMTKVLYTGSPFVGKEVVYFKADMAAHYYSTDTLVTTSSKVSVVAATSIMSLSASASGYSGQHLIVTLKY